MSEKRCRIVHNIYKSAKPYVAIYFFRALSALDRVKICLRCYFLFDRMICMIFLQEAHMGLTPINNFIIDNENIAWHGMAWHGMAWHGMAWHGMAWHGIT